MSLVSPTKDVRVVVHSPGCFCSHQHAREHDVFRAVEMQNRPDLPPLPPESALQNAAKPDLYRCARTYMTFKVLRLLQAPGKAVDEELRLPVL